MTFSTRFRALIRRSAWLAAALVFALAITAARAELRVGTFRVDATPPLGDTMIWAVKLVKIYTPLLAKGVILEDGADRYVLCTVDYCIIGNDTELSLRTALAKAAGTRPERVAVHTLHQHDAPYADEGAHRLLDAAPKPMPHLSDAFLNDFRQRLAAAAAESVKKLEPFDQVGFGAAAVERVASYRRLVDAQGKPVSRTSASGANKFMASAPEGPIDPLLRTVTLARGGKSLVRLHYYATHPQTISCDGGATADFVGEAREALEQEEGAFQVYFTGCCGDVTVGKYNDTTTAARSGLRERLLAGMKAAAAATKYQPAERLAWRSAELRLPLRDAPGFADESRGWLSDPQADDGLRVYRGAIRTSFIERINRPIAVSSLQLGTIHIVHLPGEPVIEYQKFALAQAKGEPVAVAGYGDYGPAYICTDKMFGEGGYEPMAANTGPGSEAPMKAAIKKLLGKED